MTTGDEERPTLPMNLVGPTCRSAGRAAARPYPVKGFNARSFRGILTPPLSHPPSAVLLRRTGRMGEGAPAPAEGRVRAGSWRGSMIQKSCVVTMNPGIGAPVSDPACLDGTTALRRDGARRSPFMESLHDHGIAPGGLEPRCSAGFPVPPGREFTGHSCPMLLVTERAGTGKSPEPADRNACATMFRFMERTARQFVASDPLSMAHD
jgi:hypothetical protein